jgi:hypothetical protein
MKRSARGDLLRGFAVRAAVAEQLPTRSVFLDVAGKRPLPAAVVPFDEVGIDLGDCPKARQFTRLRGTLQGTGEHADKGESPQSLTQLTRMLLAAFIQRQVGSTRVLVGVRPRRIAMPGEVELG